MLRVGATKFVLRAKQAQPISWHDHGLPIHFKIRPKYKQNMLFPRESRVSLLEYSHGRTKNSVA